MPAGRLGELIGLTTGSVTAMVDRLERAHYVRRERDPADRRKVVITPVRNAAREAEMESLFGHMRRAFAKHLPEYTEEDTRLILDFVRRGVEALREATDSVRAGDE